MKQGIFKYIFVLGFIILLIVTYIIFYDKDTSKVEVQDQTSTVSTLITDLRLGIAGFDSLNPLVSNNKNVKEISRLIFDSLVMISNNYGFDYNLASEISKIDNVTYIIKLKENVKWQDGSDFTAQDVKFTIDTIKMLPETYGINSPYTDNLKNLSVLDIVDAYTIKLTLYNEEDFFEYNLTFPILNSNYFVNEDFINTPKNNNIIGTGMFKIIEKTDNTIKLAKNENYWNKEKQSLITEINIGLYNTIGEMYTAFKSGYIDIMDITTPDIETYIGSLRL